MNPMLLVPLAAVFFTAGALGYSYHLGRTQGVHICQEAMLAAKLKQKQEELKIAEDMNIFQQEQISEAQDKISKETALNDKLKSDLEVALKSNPPGCITDGMRDAIKNYRNKASSKGKNS